MSQTQIEGPICAVCKGPKSTHYDENGKQKTRHAFTEEEGRLETPEQQEKRLKKSQGPQPQPGMSLAQMVNAQPNSVGRLTEVLLDLKLITPQDALYVAGMQPRVKRGD